MLGAMVSGLATFLSLSTGALLSMVVQVRFLAWEYLKKPSKFRWRLIAALAVLAYVIIDLLSNRLPFHVLVTYGTITSDSSYNHILIWDHGTRTVENFPFFGRDRQLRIGRQQRDTCQRAFGL